ncbi:MAG TPA: translocation/assembly module TamB domain-containing protein [Terriglobales bacterium]|nr:translocation/assembly module TamB domain-containing protein [Terriglobales bacterium]
MNWKRILGWTAAILLGLTVLILVGGYAVLRSKRFHRYVLSKVMEKGSQATGGRVTIQSYTFSPSKLTADVYGVVIHGTEAADQAPLLAVDRLTIRLKILSVMQRRVNLNELLIEHPVVHLIVNREGQLNLPSPNAPRDTSSQTNIFDLAVRHVGLYNGAIFYNDLKMPLQADIADLKTDVRFETLQKRYSGSVAYQTGHLKYGNYTPLPHGLQAQFAMTPSEASLSSLQVKIGNSQAVASATVTNYGSPRVEGSYRLLLHCEDFAEMIKNGSASGDVALAGSIHYQSSNEPFLKSVLLDGNLESKELRLSAEQGRLAVSAIRGRYQLANGNLSLQPFTANLLEGRVVADFTMQHLEATPAARVRAELQQISLEAAKQSLKRGSLNNVPLTGTLKGMAEASWVGSMANLRANSSLSVLGALRSQSGNADTPLNADVHAAYDGKEQRITLRQTSIKTPATSVTVGGEISRRSNLVLHAQTADLKEMSRLTSDLQSGGKPLNISGTAEVDATVRGSLQRPLVDGQVNARDLRIEGSSWRSLHAGLQASASQFTVQNASLLSSGQGQVSAKATVGLKNWSYTPASPITAAVSIRQMPVADLQRLARLDYPVSGILSGDVNLHGSQLEPVGSGALHLVKAEAYNQPIQNVTLKIQGTGESVHSTLMIATPAGNANADLTYSPKARTYQLNASAPQIALQQLQAVQAKNLAVNGYLSAMAQGTGSIDNPQLVASVQAPQLQFKETTINGIKADLKVANHLATFTMGSDVAEAAVRAHAVVHLTGDYYAEANVDTTRVALDPLLAVYVSALPTGAQAQVELHASLKGPLKDKSRLEAHLQIPTLQASYQQLQIGNSGPIRLDYANNLITIQPSELKGTDTSLRIHGQVPIETGRAMDLTAQGQINLKLLRILTPDIRSAGLVNLDLRGTGNFRKPGVKGQIRLQQVALTTSDVPVGVEKLDGVLDVANGQVQITKLEGQSGGGQISGSGTINYEPHLQFNMALNAKSVRLLYPDGLRSVLDGNILLTGDPQSAALNGQVLIDSLSFTPDFDLAKFATQFGTPSLPPPNPTFADKLKLNVAVQTSSDLSAISSTVSIEGTVSLRVIGTAANPVIVGRTDLTSGEVFFAGQRYQLERGLINFTNPSRTEPYLNVLITTAIQQYNLSLTIVGPVEKLETKYTADPPLPPVDIINLIARGQTTEESVPGNFSANQVLAKGLASQVSSRLGKFAGISSLTIDPNLGGNNQNPSARIAIQQRVTRNFVFTFSTDVTQPQSEIVQGEYQLNKRWSVSATRDQFGGFAFAGKYHTSF